MQRTHPQPNRYYFRNNRNTPEVRSRRVLEAATQPHGHLLRAARRTPSKEKEGMGREGGKGERKGGTAGTRDRNIIYQLKGKKY